MMAFAMGFAAGTAFPETPVFYYATVIGICALAKIELGHYAKKHLKESGSNR